MSPVLSSKQTSPQDPYALLQEVNGPGRHSMAQRVQAFAATLEYGAHYQTQRECCFELAKIGRRAEEAIPQLEAAAFAVLEGDPDLRGSMRRASKQIVTRLVNDAAVYALGKVGAVEPLVRVLRNHPNEVTRHAAVLPLGENLKRETDAKIQRSGILALAKAVSDDYSSVRLDACRALGRLRKQGAPGVPALKRALQFEKYDPELSEEARKAIKKIQR